VAHQWGCITPNPAFSFRLKKPSEKPRKKPDHKAIVSMIEYAEGDNRGLIACYYYGGMRKSESPGLKWKDIDFGNDIITISRQYYRGKISEPKADSSKRQYRVPHELIRILENRKKQTKQNQPDDWLFPSRDKSPKFHGKPIDIDGWYKNHYKPIRIKFGLDYTLTDLRKAYENVWKKFNLDLAIRQKQMRHSDIRTTMKYYDYVDDEDTIAAVDGFDTYIRSLKSEIRHIKRAK
jgi:integrase